MLLDAPLGFVQTVLYGMANSREPFQIGGVESEKGRVLRSFDNQRVFEFYHGFPAYFRPAVFRIALQVPVGTSLEL